MPATFNDLAAEIARDAENIAFAKQCGVEMPLYEQRAADKRAELSQGIDLASLSNRIDQIPVIHQPRGNRLYCTIGDRDVEIFGAGEYWHWRTIDYPWHHPLFMDSKPQYFASAEEARQDAINRIAEPEQCQTCGDHHEPDTVPFTCQTGDGQ